MAESRDRLSRPVDLAQVFARRRSGTLGIFSDESHELLVSPVQQRNPTAVGVLPSTPRGGVRRRVHRRSSFGTPGSGIGPGRTLYRAPAMGRENAPVTGRGRGRGTGSVLPSWYPRVPLQDITTVLRAIERRRAGLGGSDGLTIETPTREDESQRVLSSDVSYSSGAQLQHNFKTPASTARLKRCPPSVRNVSKILLSVTDMNAEESELLTPQKRLLNSIDTVEKAVMEEVEKMKRTPSAKKAERQNKVRTLMSMR